MKQVQVSEMKGPLGELMNQFSGANGRARFEEFKLWLKRVTVHLRVIFCDLEIPATDGTKTFESSGVFLGEFDRRMPATVNCKRAAAKVLVFQMTMEGEAVRILRGLGENRTYFTEHQVAEFCKIHRDKIWNGDGATLFEVQEDILASVSFNEEGHLEVGVYPLSDPNFAHYDGISRICILQQ